MKTRLLALSTAALLLAACNQETPPPPQPAPAEPAATAAPAPAVEGVKPVDVPAGYGYPGNRDEFQAWADAWKIDQITTAAWNLWAGMTSDSGQKWNGAVLPVWETWCGNEEVFSPAGCQTMGRPARGFMRPHQIGHMARLKGAAGPSDTAVVSFNKFNPSMTAYIAARHAGPGGEYAYNAMQDLANLNAAWPAETPIASRTLEEAPYQPDEGGKIGFAGMETKPVVFLVKDPKNLPQGQALTPVPLWQGTAQSNSPGNAVPESWFTCVLLDPANHSAPDTAPVPATPQQIAQMVPTSTMSCKTFLYAPLSTIYSFQMDAAEANSWNELVDSDQTGDGGQSLLAEAGDYGVLAAMHVNTKAISNWTWETFWWQPGGDTPAGFPGSKQGMTDNVAGAWRNYAMCTAWNQTKGNASKDMVVCFNPYLETSSQIPAGQSSNCVSCHGTATVGSPLTGKPPSLLTLDYPPAYKQPIDFKNDPRYATFTRTDFSWAIPGNAFQPATPPADATAAAPAPAKQ